MQVDSQSQCMEDSISYKASPPSNGPYRPLAPKYGDYRYLPPQRWLHTLKTGGVAFLYHPCADPDQIDRLKFLAQSCLKAYIITPYKNLTKDKVRVLGVNLSTNYYFPHLIPHSLWQW